MKDWRVALLKNMGLPKTPQNLKFLGTWQRWEGGHTHNSARFNWLNTTNDSPGAVGEINSVGVKAFDSFASGIQATIRTLTNGHYDDIVAALGSGNPYGQDLSRGLSTWVGGPNAGINQGYVRKIMGGAAPPPPATRAATLAAKKRDLVQSTPRPPVGSSPDPAWDTAMKMIFDDDPEFAEIMAQMDDVTFQKAGIVSKRGSLKPVAIDQAAPGAAKSLVQISRQALGKPYVFGSGPGTDSFDCSDLIQWTYRQIGINLPRVTYDQLKEGRSVKGQKLQPGDLIFPHRGHVVMYVGGGKVIAAPYTGTVVQYQPVPQNPLEVRRIL